MGLSRITRVPYSDLEEFTDNFSEDNLIGKFQFGKIYHGKFHHMLYGTKEYTVKMWDDSSKHGLLPLDNESRLMDEYYLLQHEQYNFHPCLVKLVSFCCEGEKLGVIYDHKALDTVYYLMLKDSFTWLQRIKVAFGIACLLKFFHAQKPPYLPCLVRNIDAAHIMLDKDYNPKLFDFGMITGGIFPDRTKLQIQCGNGRYGYVYPSSGVVDGWSEKCDVFAFGVLLLMLIAKIVDVEGDRLCSDAPFVYEWAWKHYKTKKSIIGFGRSGCSLVHESLETEPDFCSSDGPRITELAMRCLHYNPTERPSMKNVVKCLLGLQVVRRHSCALGLDQMLLVRDPNL